MSLCKVHSLLWSSSEKNRHFLQDKDIFRAINSDVLHFVSLFQCWKNTWPWLSSTIGTKSLGSGATWSLNTLKPGHSSTQTSRALSRARLSSGSTCFPWTCRYDVKWLVLCANYFAYFEKLFYSKWLIDWDTVPHWHTLFSLTSHQIRKISALSTFQLTLSFGKIKSG